MKKKILSMLLAVIMLLGMVTFSASAADSVYISVSENGQYLGDLAHVEVDLAALAAISLEDYGLSDYSYDADSDGTAEITALHLVIYTHTELLGLDWDTVTVSGGAGSIFFEAGLFGASDCNMNYYINGVYPAIDGWGVTIDQYVLSSGDFVDFAIFSSWNFMVDSGAGFHYFMDSQDAITHSYTATAGEAMTLKLGRAWGAYGGETELYAEPSYTVYYGSTAFSDSADSVTTDDSGEASISFAEAGTYYLWANGAKGVDMDLENIVSSPAYAVVTVEAAAEAPTVPEVENNTGETPAASYRFSDDGSTLTVQGEVACAVLVQASDGSCTRLAATANAEGGYDFDTSQLPEGSGIVIAVKGDLNGDGSVGIADAAQVKAVQLGNLTLNGAAALLADVSGDGSIGIADAAQIKAAQLGTLSFGW